MSFLRFDGRVAIVTGAGRGLGRDYALLLASRGAKVVVNDLGVDLSGLGKNSRPVDEVVSTIRSQGGTAVPNYDSVEDGEKVVKTAIDNFGRVDILINNAGIIRDRSIAKLSDLDWDLVHKVHLRGSFMMSRAAWPFMKKQSYGRIIMTSSTSGLYGNFGQSNYSAAKLGLVGFANTLSKEGQKYNIFVNTIAPSAISRLTEGLMPPEATELLKPEYVAPVVCYLCHEICKDNGILIESAGGWAAKVRLQKSGGVAMRRSNKPFTVEDVRDNWSKICDMSHPVYHTSNMEATPYTLTEIVNKLTSDTQSSPTDINSAIGYTFSPEPFTYTHRDVILYALGIGANISQEDNSELKFLYEGHEEFSAIPSYGVIPAQSAMMGVSMAAVLGNFHMANLLHGEQYIEIKKPIPTSGTLTHNAVVRDILDKKSGAVILVDVESFDESGELICFNQFSTFVVGAGGFGGKRSSDYVKPTVATPDCPPSASVKEKTASSQAALYRLSGDYNPLHIDPQFAAVGGFSTPILHGLCSYGIATRHILKQYCNYDANMIKSIKARFAKPVLPGHTVQTNMWNEGNRILFNCKIIETGDTVLTGGCIELNATVPTTNSVTPGEVGSTSQLKSDALFEQMKEIVKTSDGELVKKIKAIYLWNITKDGKTVSKWTVDLKNQPGAIYSGEPKGIKPGCTLTLSDESFVGLVNGDLNPQQAFFQGLIKITGNIMLSQKLQLIFNEQSKL